MMKKGFALFMAGAMMVSRPVMAATNTETAAMVSQAVSVSVAPRILFADVSSDGRSSIETMLASAAMAEDKTVGEYMNNAVTRLPGLENVTPLGQGGHVIINGVPGNQTFSVLKPHYAYVNFAKTLAGGVGGRVLNVAEIKASVPFDTATVNFYAEDRKSTRRTPVT